MKKKLKRFLIGAGALSVVGATAGVVLSVTSCSAGVGVDVNANSWKGDKRDMKQSVMANNGINPLANTWYITSSAHRNTGIPNQNAIADVAPRLISYTYGDAVINKDTTLSTRPKKYIQFDLASAIWITVQEVDPVTHLPKGGTTPQVVKFTSDSQDPKDASSVNGDVFTGIMKDLTYNGKNVSVLNLQFKIRQTKWVDNNGKETKYDLKPSDFVWGNRMMYWYYLPFARKAAAAGIESEEKAVEDNINTDHGGGSALFISRVLDNRYLQTVGGMDGDAFFGMNSNNIVDDSIMQKIVGNDTDTIKYDFSVLDRSKQNPIFAFINTWLNPITFYSPVPHAWIQDQIKKSHDGDNNWGKGGKYNVSSGALYDSGFFVYGRDYEHMLYAGKYYISENSTKRFEVKRNTHYGDSRWDAKNNRLNSYTINYVSGDPSTFANQLLNNFNEGIQGFIEPQYLAKLSPEVILKVFGNKDANAWVSQASGTQGNFMGWTTNPQIVQGPDVFKQYMNDNFVSLMFGRKTINEMVSKGPDLNASATGSGMAFRNMLSAAVNWFGVVNEASQGTNSAWTPSLPVGATDHDGNSLFTNAMNTQDVWAWKADGDNGHPVKTTDTVSNEDNEKVWKESTNAQDQLKSAKYQEIRTNMISMLDDFKQRRLITAGSDGKYEIQFNLPLYTGFTDNPTRQAYKDLANMFNHMLDGSDYRLNISTNWTKNYNPDFNTDVKPQTVGIAAQSFIGWSSDINEAVSWMMGYVAGGYGENTLVNAWSQLADTKYLAEPKNSWLAAAFPQTADIIQNQVKPAMDGFINDYITQIQKNPGQWLIDPTKSGADTATLIAKMKSNLYMENWHNVTHHVDGKTELGNIAGGEFTLMLDDQTLISNIKSDKVTLLDGLQTTNMLTPVLKIGAYLETKNGGDKKKADKDYFDFVREFNEIVGYGMTFDTPVGGSNSISNPNKPTEELKKVWLHISPDVEGIIHIGDWYVK